MIMPNTVDCSIISWSSYTPQAIGGARLDGMNQNGMFKLMSSAWSPECPLLGMDEEQADATAARCAPVLFELRRHLRACLERKDARAHR